MAISLLGKRILGGTLSTKVRYPSNRTLRCFTNSRELWGERPPQKPKISTLESETNTEPLDTDKFVPKETDEDPQDRDEPLTVGRYVVGSIILTCCGFTAWYSTTTNNGIADRKKYQIFEDNFVLSRRNIREGRWWTVITSSFAHTSLTHLMVNMFCLWTAGPLVYTVLGPAKFAVLYLGSAVTGSALQLSWWAYEKRPAWMGAVGASGSLAGLFTFAAGLWPRMGVTLFFFIPMRLWQGIAAFAGFSVTALAEGWFPGLGHADHLGGMAFGAAYASYLLLGMRRGRRTLRYKMKL